MSSEMGGRDFICKLHAGEDTECHTHSEKARSSDSVCFSLSSTHEDKAITCLYIAKRWITLLGFRVAAKTGTPRPLPHLMAKGSAT